MFGLNKKTKARITAMEERVAKNSKLVEEDHADLVELKLAVKNLEKAIQAIGNKTGELQQRQNALRLALSEGMRTEPAVDENGND